MINTSPFNMKFSTVLNLMLTTYFHTQMFRLASRMLKHVPKSTCTWRSLQTFTSEHAEDIRFDVLETALSHVKHHGWTEKSLKKALSDHHLSETAIGMFPHGPVEIVLHLNLTLNDDLEDMMAQQMEARQFKAEVVPIKDVLEDAIKTRLKMIVPYINNWSDALALQLDPKVAPMVLQQFTDLIDDIWWYAGDESVDVTWYTRRAAIAAVYAMTELYMLQDTCPDYSNTWTFLNRRLVDLEELGNERLAAEKHLEEAGNFAKAAFIIARNMLSPT